MIVWGILIISKKLKNEKKGNRKNVCSVLQVFEAPGEVLV